MDEFIEVTEPVVLDETARSINDTLQEIKGVLDIGRTGENVLYTDDEYSELEPAEIRDADTLGGRVTAETIDELRDNTGDAWNDLTNYKVGDYCIYENALYKCKTAHTDKVPTNTTYWTRTRLANDVNQLNRDLLNVTPKFTTATLNVVNSGVTVNYPSGFNVSNCMVYALAWNGSTWSDYYMVNGVLTPAVQIVMGNDVIIYTRDTHFVGNPCRVMFIPMLGT